MDRIHLAHDDSQEEGTVKMECSFVPHLGLNAVPENKKKNLLWSYSKEHASHVRRSTQNVLQEQGRRQHSG